jgi:hypothetical protein
VIELLHFFDQLTDVKPYGHFRQDNATAHLVNNSVVALREVFDKRIKCRGCGLSDNPI